MATRQWIEAACARERRGVLRSGGVVGGGHNHPRLQVLSALLRTTNLEFGFPRAIHTSVSSLAVGVIVVTTSVSTGPTVVICHVGGWVVVLKNECVDHL